METARWIAGFATGSVWSGINLMMTAYIARVAILQQSPASLRAALLVKFPLLYLAGFLILTLRLMPIVSILAGILAVPVAVGVYKGWLKLK